jgi:hypothetical protein
MDEASRQQRLDDWRAQPNVNLVHSTATAEEFRAFDKAKLGHADSPLARVGFWAHVRGPGADVPTLFAEHAIARAETEGVKAFPRSMPLVHRSKKPGVIEYSPNWDELAHTISGMWKKGYDAVTVRNFPVGRRGRGGTADYLVVKDASQLRSPYARFDPMYRHDPDLLRGLAGAGVAAGGLTLEAEERGRDDPWPPQPGGNWL